MADAIRDRNTIRLFMLTGRSCGGIGLPVSILDSQPDWLDIIEANRRMGYPIHFQGEEHDCTESVQSETKSE